MNSDSQGI